MAMISVNCVKCSDIWFSNSGGYDGRICNFWDVSQKLEFTSKYLRMNWTDLDQIFRFSRSAAANDKSDIHFTVVQGTLL